MSFGSSKEKRVANAQWEPHFLNCKSDKKHEKVQSLYLWWLGNLKFWK